MAKTRQYAETIFDSTKEAMDAFEQAIRAGRLFNVYAIMNPDNMFDHVVYADPILTRDEMTYLESLEDDEKADDKKIPNSNKFTFPLTKLMKSSDTRAAWMVEYATHAQEFRTGFLFVADGQAEKEVFPRRKKRAA